MAKIPNPALSPHDVEAVFISQRKINGKGEHKFMPGHDIIVIGTSAGGVEALRELTQGLPPDLPAAIFVVLHVPPTGPSVLPEILNRSGLMPAHHAIDGEFITH